MVAQGLGLLHGACSGQAQGYIEGCACSISCGPSTKLLSKFRLACKSCGFDVGPLLWCWKCVWGALDSGHGGNFSFRLGDDRNPIVAPAHSVTEKEMSKP